MRPDQTVRLQAGEGAWEALAIAREMQAISDGELYHRFAFHWQDSNEIRTRVVCAASFYRAQGHAEQAAFLEAVDLRLSRAIGRIHERVSKRVAFG